MDCPGQGANKKRAGADETGTTERMLQSQTGDDLTLLNVDQFQRFIQRRRAPQVKVDWRAAKLRYFVLVDWPTAFDRFLLANVNQGDAARADKHELAALLGDWRHLMRLFAVRQILQLDRHIRLQRCNSCMSLCVNAHNCLALGVAIRRQVDDFVGALLIGGGDDFDLIFFVGCYVAYNLFTFFKNLNSPSRPTKKWR